MPKHLNILALCKLKQQYVELDKRKIKSNLISNFIQTRKSLDTICRAFLKVAKFLTMLIISHSSCRTLSDELSRLWRLAVLSPGIPTKQRQGVIDQLRTLNQTGNVYSTCVCFGVNFLFFCFFLFSSFVSGTVTCYYLIRHIVSTTQH